MIDLTGETAIVTGAAQGFGAEIATRMGEAGANVVLADVQAEKGRGVADEIAADGVEAEFVECDVTDRDAAEAMVERAVDRFGSVEILVNNAGGAGDETFQEIDDEAWQFGLDLNLTGPYNCSKAVMPGMLEHGDGRIVNISSMAGRNVTVNGNPSYTASKWGLIGLTKHAARDLGPDIRVNAVCPGGSPRGPMGRFVEADDVADGVLFLASDLSEFVDGTVLEVDGGGHLNLAAKDLDLDYSEMPDDG